MQIAAGHNLAMSFVTDELFSGLNFSVESGAHIGLVGINGSGKSTLCRIISGRLEPTAGQVIFARECRLAYMEQFLQARESDTLYEATLGVFAPLLELERRMAEVNSALERQADAALLREQSRLQELYAEGGGYTYRARLRSALLGLGFAEAELELPVRALSGGQRSKAALAKTLLCNANLLLLDEPTNHLDIESVRWLESYLSTYRGAFIVVSHDRYFLDQITTETWDMHHGRMQCFQGNYSRHLELRAGEEEVQRHRYQSRLREIRRIEGIIAQQKRFNQAHNYVTIASKQKQIDRLKAELGDAPENAERQLHFSFNSPPPGGNEVLDVHNAAKSFGSKHLFCHADLRVDKGERVFLLGANGCGKSTLMKIIMGQEYLDEGCARLGVNIFPTYYDQLHGHISGRETILQYFTDRYPRLTQTAIRTMLGSFLFSADEVEKTLDMLSGGEKARLELMKLILEPANLLLLDEPTNHLDIASCEAMEQALQEYPGAMLVVSHDRYLINKLADRVYYMTPDGLIESIGNYDDYLLTREKLDAAAAENAAASGAAAPAGGDADAPFASAASTVGGGEQDYRRRKEEQAAARKRERRLKELAARAAAAETRLDEIAALMADPANAADYQLLMRLQEEKDALELDYLAILEEQENPE